MCYINGIREGFGRRIGRPTFVCWTLLACFVASVQGRPADCPRAKWHPGHYVFVNTATLSENHVLPHFLGVQKVYGWAELEPEKDRYDFSAIRRDLAFLERHGKRLVIQLQLKGFGSERYAPDYIQGAEYGGGVFWFEPTRKDASGQQASRGYNPILWNAKVNERVLALIRALGREFNKEPFLEAVNLPETAVSGKRQIRMQTHIEPFDEEVYLEVVKQQIRTLRQSFPDTVVIQYANFPPAILPDLVACLRECGTGLGGPDVSLFEWREKMGLGDPEKGVFRFYPQLSGEVPLGAAVQGPNYSAFSKKTNLMRIRERDGHEDPTLGGKLSISAEDKIRFPPGDIFRLARDELKLNYLFWAITPSEDFQAVQAWMKSADFPKDAAGGLDDRIPAKAFAVRHR